MMCAVSRVILDARRAALSGLVDHAALFPPASMSVPDALAEDERVRAEETGWLVHRFVAPVSRLAELDGAELPLSLVLDEAYGGDDPRVEAVEARPGAAPERVAGLAAEVYVELPADLERLAALGLRAKVRCGGASVPSGDELAAVVRDCRRLGLVFKATAGLHHAVAQDGQHGFLNLLAACAFPGDETAALAERDPTAFALDPQGLRWGGRAAGVEELSRVRAELFAGFGSCSVAEPVGELQALGIL
jgi:hypothetical protein